MFFTENLLNKHASLVCVINHLLQTVFVAHTSQNINNPHKNFQFILAAMSLHSVPSSTSVPGLLCSLTTNTKQQIDVQIPVFSSWTSLNLVRGHPDNVYRICQLADDKLFPSVIYIGFCLVHEWQCQHWFSKCLSQGMACVCSKVKTSNWALNWKSCAEG